MGNAVRGSSFLAKVRGSKAIRSKSSGRSKDKKRGLVRRLLPTMLTVGMSLLLVAGMGLLPAKTWLEQRESIAVVEADLDQVNGRVAALSNQLGLLETDAEVERTARKNFDLVYPGEESYRILPAPETE